LHGAQTPFYPIPLRLPDLALLPAARRGRRRPTLALRAFPEP
jgi:hypothetical protein